MLLPVKFLPFIFILSQCIALPQVIKQINFTGNNVLSSNELLNVSGITGSRYQLSSIDSAIARIAAAYNQTGYFNASFLNKGIQYSPDSSFVIINISIDEGSPAYIKNIQIADEDSILTQSLLSSFRYMEGGIYNKSEIENNISSVLSYMEDEGYPFGRVIVNSVQIYSDSVSGENYADVFISVKRETGSRIDRVEIEGNTSTKDYVITRELRLEPGEKYSQQKIEELPERLNKLKFFDPVPVPDFYVTSKNEGVLLIKVKEKQTNNFDGVIGYVPAAAEGQKGYLTGLVNVSLRNLFGTGRAAAIRWQQLNKNSQELELKYLEPWLFSYPFNLNGRLYQRKQDTTYVQRNLEGSLEFLATESISAAVSIATESVIPTLRDDNVFTVYNSSSLTTGINLTIDTRDDPYAPLGGVYFINSYSFSRKKINGPAGFIYEGLETNINLQRIALDLAGFYELFSRQVVALGVHGRELRGSMFEASDLYRLGGTNTLRGYREEQFYGSRIFWSNLEYRLLLTRRSFAFVFFDTGYYLRNAEPDRGILKQEDFNTGYGLGLSIETGLGVLGVSFAIAGGNSFSDGLIHFGIVNEF
jgi:outer membrane protein insertion porin family